MLKASESAAAPGSKTIPMGALVRKLGSVELVLDSV